MALLPVAYSCMALSYNPRTHYFGIVSMLLSNTAVRILEMMKRMVYKTPHPSLVDLFGGLRHVSCLQKPTVKVLNITLLVWSSFSPHICISSKKHFLHSSLLKKLLRAQGTEEMGARPYTVSPHNFYPTVKTPDGSLRCK